jgi:hypothetical protein
MNKAGRSGSGGNVMRKTYAALILAVIAAVALAVPALAATPPDLPHNLVIFPERDFVVLEGYEDRAGQSVTVTVERDGVQTSSATGTVGDGDPSLEINHPGGLCWEGVTPNIKPGDVVTAAFADHEDSARTINVRAGDAVRNRNGTPRNANDDRLVIRGFAGDAGEPGGRVPLAKLEQRIINPALTSTRIGRRDIRADSAGGRVENVPGGRGVLRYDSATSKNWTATYTGLNDREIRIALQGQVRILSWMDTGLDDERAGITIYERGEVGGPGFGGCPPGPEASAPNAPQNVAANAGNQSVRATWERPVLVPDGGAITGYRVTAIRISNGVETSLDFGANARTGRVPSLINGEAYNVEVTARSGPRFGPPGTAGPVTPAAP